MSKNQRSCYAELRRSLESAGPIKGGFEATVKLLPRFGLRLQRAP